MFKFTPKRLIFITGLDWICLIVLNMVQCNKKCHGGITWAKVSFKQKWPRVFHLGRDEWKYTDSVCTSMNRDSVVSTVTRLWAGQPRNFCLTLASSEAHSFSYLVGMRGSFSCCKTAWTRSCLLAWCACSFPMSSWCPQGHLYLYWCTFTWCWHLKLTTLVIYS
jgi:hypothetical protein